MRLHHIGYLVKKMEKAVKQFSILGFKTVSDIIYDQYRDIDIMFMEKDGYVIELVSPKSSQSVVAGLMKKYKNTPYHICYESVDFCGDLKDLESNGFKRFEEPCPAPALGNRKVSFLVSPVIGLVEVLEGENGASCP